jgi:hypothetical protein
MLATCNLTPWKRAAAVAKEADDEERDSTVYMYGTLTSNRRVLPAYGHATRLNAGTKKHAGADRRTTRRTGMGAPHPELKRLPDPQTRGRPR